MSVDIDARIHEIEKLALCGDAKAMTLIVSFARHYRQAAKKLLASRYRDGECDAVALNDFEAAIEEAEETLLLEGE